MGMARCQMTGIPIDAWRNQTVERSGPRDPACAARSQSCGSPAAFAAPNKKDAGPVRLQENSRALQRLRGGTGGGSEGVSCPPPSPAPPVTSVASPSFLSVPR